MPYDLTVGTTPRSIVQRYVPPSQPSIAARRKQEEQKERRRKEKERKAAESKSVDEGNQNLLPCKRHKLDIAEPGHVQLLNFTRVPALYS